MQPRTLIPLNWPITLWMAFMAAVSAVLSLGFACAAPLAAFAAASGLTLSRRNAILATLAAWLANQAAGCAFLGYPLTVDTLAWGGVLGLGATLAMFAARWTGARVHSLSGLATPVAAFAAAFAVYEATLFAAALAFLGGTEEFTIAIIARVFEINAIVMLGLLLLNYAAALIGNSIEPGKSAPFNSAHSAQG
jgi:hypothetical protein